jgi:hypothetical protein
MNNRELARLIAGDVFASVTAQADRVVLERFDHKECGHVRVGVWQSEKQLCDWIARILDAHRPERKDKP